MSYIDDVKAALQMRLSDCDDELLDLYTLLCLAVGEDTTSEQVHDAWAVWRARTRPDHPSIVEFDELTEAVQRMDDKYRDAIVEVAINLWGGAS